jgi:CRP-like cAMP-binding protein
VVIIEGERDRRLFVVVSGEVEVIKNLGGKNESSMGTLGPFSYFGEMSLIDDLVRSASVIAKTKTQLISLDHWNLRDHIEKYPALAVELLQMMSRRLRAVEKSMLCTLGTFLPICARCKKIRLENDSWLSIEEYIEDHSEAEFSHGICPACSKELYPELDPGNRS